MLAKELRSELRSRVALNAVGLFALTTLVAVAYQIGPYRIHAEDRPHLLAALLWIILFFAALSGLARVFVKEEDAHTAKTLRLAARPLAVLLGKLLFNLLLLLALETCVVLHRDLRPKSDPEQYPQPYRSGYFQGSRLTHFCRLSEVPTPFLLHLRASERKFENCLPPLLFSFLLFHS